MVSPELIIIIIGAIVLASIVKLFSRTPKKHCDICDTELDLAAAPPHIWIIDGASKRVCSSCNPILHHKFADVLGELHPSPQQSAPQSHTPKRELVFDDPPPQPEPHQETHSPEQPPPPTHAPNATPPRWRRWLPRLRRKQH